MNGLKFEPGWRSAWITRLNLLFVKSKPPTSAWTAPSRVAIETRAPSTFGTWAKRQ